MDPNEICIGGNKYRVVQCSGATGIIQTIPQSNTDVLNEINNRIRILSEYLIPKMPAYRYLSRTIVANSTREEISLGMKARHLYINTTHTVKVYLYSSGGDPITLTSADSPLTINDLNRMEEIDKIYIDTDANGTVLTIFALGEVL